MECVRCVVAQQQVSLPPDPNDIDRFDFSEEAGLIYAGESICISHFNLVRGHHAQYGDHFTPRNRIWAELRRA